MSEERLSLDARHREEPATSVGEELVEPNEVRVDQIGERSELVLQAIDRDAVEVLEGLERYDLAALLVERFEDDAHAAFAEATAHLESPSEFAADDGLVRHALGP